MDVKVSSKVEVLDANVVKSTFDSSATKSTYANYTRNVETVAISAVKAALPTGSVTVIKYAKIYSDQPVDISLDDGVAEATFAGVTRLEMEGSNLGVISITGGLVAAKVEFMFAE